METPSAEEITKHITNAYDSIALIDELNAKDSLNSEEQDTLDRNKEHIRVMLAKTWFSDGLTTEQNTELTTKSAED